MPGDPVSTTADITYRGQYRVAKVPPCLITPDDLRKLFTELDERTSEALEKHIAGLRRPPTTEERDWNQTLHNLRHDARLTITVQGADGEQLVTRTSDVLPTTNSQIGLHSCVLTARPHFNF